MIGLPPSTRVFLCLPPTDMRKSFDGLAALAVDVVRQEPLSGHLFVFRNRREDRIKVLYWDRTGFCLFYKRLEQGTFRFPAFAKASADGRAEAYSGYDEVFRRAKASRSRSRCGTGSRSGWISTSPACCPRARWEKRSHTHEATGRL